MSSNKLKVIGDNVVSTYQDDYKKLYCPISDLIGEKLYIFFSNLRPRCSSSLDSLLSVLPSTHEENNKFIFENEEFIQILNSLFVSILGE